MRYGLGIAVAVSVTLGIAGAAFAKADPAAACAAVKLKAVGASASARLACHVAAAQKGVAVDAACLDGASAKLLAAFAKAEAAAAKAGSVCPSVADASQTDSEAQTFVEGVVTALRPRAVASKCVAKKLGTVGKYAQKLLGAHGANLVKADAAKLVGKTTNAEAVLVKTFGKLDEKAKDCQTSGDASGMLAGVTDLLAMRICDDHNLCTNDDVAGLVCQNVPITCGEHSACDFRTGSCVPTNCCLMSSGTGLCVVEIPIAEIPTSQSFCQSIDTANANLILLNFGPQCIGWRAAGAADCF